MSSLTIVPRPCPSAMVALTGRQVDEERLVGLDVVSPQTVTSIVVVVEPAGMVAVPEVVSSRSRRGSSRQPAVPGAVA